jgi:hypothetical protein
VLFLVALGFAALGLAAGAWRGRYPALADRIERFDLAGADAAARASARTPADEARGAERRPSSLPVGRREHAPRGPSPPAPPLHSAPPPGSSRGAVIVGPGSGGD